MPPRKLKTNNLWLDLGALVAVSFWGFSFVATKVVMEIGGLSPTEAYLYRFVFAYLIILLLFHKRIFCNNWRDEFLMLLCGMSAGSIYFITENTALNLTSTANVSLLSSTSPLVTILIIGLIYKSERPGRGIIIGSLVAFLGVCCVIFNSALQSGAHAAIEINPLGDLLALSTSFSWALYSLIIKRLNVIYDAWFITRKTFFYGIVTGIPFLFIEPHLANPLVVLGNPLVVGNLAFLILCPSITSYFLWSVIIKKMGAIKANNFLYFQPIVTLVAGALVLGETVSVLGYLGFALILFGLWLGDFLQNRIKPRLQ